MNCPNKIVQYCMPEPLNIVLVFVLVLNADLYVSTRSCELFRIFHSQMREKSFDNQTTEVMKLYIIVL